MTLVLSAIRTFRNIATYVDRPNISPKVITQITVSLLVIVDVTCVLNLLSVLITLMDQKRLVQNLIDSPIDFLTILDQTQAEGRTIEGAVAEAEKLPESQD